MSGVHFAHPQREVLVETLSKHPSMSKPVPFATGFGVWFCEHPPAVICVEAPRGPSERERGCPSHNKPRFSRTHTFQ